MGFPKIIPKWAFQVLCGALVLGAAGVSLWFASTVSDDADVAFAVSFLVALVVLLPVILLLRAFSKMPTLREQGKDLQKFLGISPTSPADPDLASVGSRIAAFLIDRILAVTIVTVCVVPTIVLREAVGAKGWIVVLIVAALLPGIFYAWARDAFGGRSIARRLLKQRVVDAATRKPIGAGRSFLRELMLHVGPLPIIELVLLGTRADRRRLGDQLAKTIVIREPPKV